MRSSEPKTILTFLKNALLLVAFIGSVLECAFFFSLENVFGCIMTIFVTVIFTQFYLKEDIVLMHPFPFMMFFAMYLYRFLPLPCTLLERKPITYGLEMPYLTFSLEILMFLIGCASFSIVKRRPVYTYGLRKWLNTFGCYGNLSKVTIWSFGIIGTCCTILAFIRSGSGALTSFISAFCEFRYMPILLFFPCLYREEYDIETEKGIDFSKRVVWAYLIFVTVLNLGSNSRYALVTPFGIFALLFLIAAVKERVRTSEILRSGRLVVIIFAVFFSISFLQSVSDSMISVRNIRTNVSKSQLIQATLENAFNSTTGGLVKEDKSVETYRNGWTEDYIDNAMLNRFANIRITDETLYYSSLLNEYGINAIRKDFYNRIVCLLPSPILNIVAPNADKAATNGSSRGDILRYYAGFGNSYTLGNLIVTSHVADGLIQFGGFYFIIQWLLWIIVFNLLDTFSTSRNGKMVYSAWGLVSVFTFLGMFRNASGCFGDVGYILREYWQSAFIFCVAMFISKLAASLFIKR